LSKLSQLKQKAYQAGKSRNWDQAIAVYEQILELDKTNPTVINELGDLCLKAGNTRKAISHFLSASSKYRKTGLLNNSVAICKKILRHDDANMHAHWYLAEIRSSQDLMVEGETHALAFLSMADDMSAEILEIFLKRCGSLLELYPASLPVMERLIQVFRTWEKPLEASRASCLKACVVYDAGEKEAAQALVDEILATSPELKNYPEFGKWDKRVNPNAVSSAPLADYNAVSLEDPTPASPASLGSPASPASPEAQASPADSSKAETSFAGIRIEMPTEISVDDSAAASPVEDKDEEGCLVIDTDDDSDMESLIAQATQDVDHENDSPTAPTAELGAGDTVPATEEAAESVDLLAQILSEDTGTLASNDSSQLETIAAEIGSVVGGADSSDDADRLYEMGMVYLEMGLFDKACESFETAAADDDYTIRAHEMWGITLQRAGRPDEAITVLTSGLQFAEVDSRENLGLRYHIGRAHELADRSDTAVEIYKEIQAVAPNFLDTTTRMRQLAGV
jgi:tetratricopeptide (TPR) repeat protein